jgi:hypothetical protein
MQSVSAAFTAEEVDKTRSIAQGLLVSWHKENLLSNVTFTIGISTIGGGDIIGANPGGIGSPGQWRYFDESNYVMSLGWERQLNMPVGGFTRALAEAELDNTSSRFLPDYMGGNSEIATAVLPKRPMIINAGFNINGVDQTVPQFSGLIKRSPHVDVAGRDVGLEGEDYVSFFDNRFIDRTALFTSVTTDTIIETFLQSSGMATSQYDLDTGLNTIPFTILESGARFADIINDLVAAENGHMFQDEQGVFRFWNRQHFNNSPFNAAIETIHTSQVINAEAPNEDHIINVVEVTGSIWKKRSAQTIFTLGDSVPILSGINTEVFASLDDPVLQVTSQTVAGNTKADGSGSSFTVTVVSRTVFAQSVKYVLLASGTGYVTQLDITGRSAIADEELYIREIDGSSRTAYEEKVLSVDNRYIQDRDWATSLSQMILDAYSEPENIQKITIRAMPHLQLGDLVSWQGRDWRIFSIRATLNPSGGFNQELIMLKRDYSTYFTIGISTIGSTDKIAP